MKSILIDTNAFSHYARGNLKVEKVIVQAEKVLVSVVSLGELYLGFKAGHRESKNLGFLSNFIHEFNVVIVGVSPETAVYYADIKYSLRSKGTPIPENDIWIAAQAVETNSMLVTLDKHFLKVSSLKIWKELKKSAMT